MTDLDFFIEGSGPVVLFLHGWGQNKEMMRPLINHLKRNYMCIAIDMPGFANSEFDKSKNITEYTKNIHDFLVNKLNVKVSYVVGHSFGGKVGIEYHLLYGVKGIVLLASPIIKPRRTFKYYYDVISYKLKKKLGIESNSGSNDYKNTKKEMKSFFVSVVNTHYNKIVKRIKIPVLLIYSKKDDKVSFRCAKYLCKNLLRSKLRVISGDHFAYLNNREIVSVEINNFFKEREEHVYYL